ncbi:MAG: hypothetical protein KAI50_14935, partial [Desulfobacterales bacterium]|nr:hypothetical protein [Desulfobacterales bacterium]
MEKTSLITLMDNGIVKIETIYRIEPAIDTFITSEAIKSPESLRNLTIKINGEELSKEDYQEFSLQDGHKYIGLKRSLIAFADINETNEVYVKYEINISTGYQFKLDLLELCQRTNQQVNVNYDLIIQSFDNNYVPVIVGNQDEFLVSHHIGGFLTLSRTYKSFDVLEEKRGLPIKNVFFINAKLRPLQVSTLKIVVDPKNNLVQEIYNCELRKVEGANPNHLIQYGISEYVEITANPKINIKNNGNEFVPIRIEYLELKSIVESGNFTEPFYYLGKGINSNENTLYVGYISNTAKTEVNIEFEYTSNRILTTVDGFHYIFEYYIFTPIHASKINDFLNFEIPEEYSIDNSNYESNLKMSFEGDFLLFSE